MKLCVDCIHVGVCYRQGAVDLNYADKCGDYEPSRHKGHWILQPSNKEQGERDFIWWKCSECGQVIFSETEHDRKEFHAFCGRCGAEMRDDGKGV